jgi:hypothetical protein
MSVPLEQENFSFLQRWVSAAEKGVYKSRYHDTFSDLAFNEQSVVGFDINTKRRLRMKRILLTVTLLLLSSLPGSAAEQTWTGQISDSMCGANHQAMAHGGKKVDARECTLECVKAGSQYVFVSKDKTYIVANQDFAGLKARAGRRVKLSGEMSADGKSITVSKIEMAKAPTSKK